MGARRTSRTRSRNAKFRRRRRSSAKLSGKLRPPMIANKETTDVERTPSLLLSSLRYWEVERDLIDEWLAVRPALLRGSTATTERVFATASENRLAP
jgi:hypothetical protein